MFTCDFVFYTNFVPLKQQQGKGKEHFKTTRMSTGLIQMDMKVT